MGQGTKVPGSELARVLLADSLPGANWPGSEKAVNRWGDPFYLKFWVAFLLRNMVCAAGPRFGPGRI